MLIGFGCLRFYIPFRSCEVTIVYCHGFCIACYPNSSYWSENSADVVDTQPSDPCVSIGISHGCTTKVYQNGSYNMGNDIEDC